MPRHKIDSGRGAAMGQAGNGTQPTWFVYELMGVLQYVPAHGGWCFLLRQEPEAGDGTWVLRRLGCCSASHGCNVRTQVGCQEQQLQLPWIVG